LRVTTHAAGAVAAPEGGTRVRLTSLWSCVHVRVPWIRAGGTYGETLLQTLSVWHQILRLAWDRFTESSFSIMRLVVLLLVATCTLHGVLGKHYLSALPATNVTCDLGIIHPDTSAQLSNGTSPRGAQAPATTCTRVLTTRASRRRASVD
jgi:hypothetical protein